MLTTVGAVTAVRHRVGLVKHRLVHDLPYRGAMRRAEVFRGQVRSQILRLPTLSIASVPAAVEVHMLCGRAQLDMGLAASWSLLRHLRGASFFVHSDGTLTDAELDVWRAVVPQLTFIAKDVGDDRAASVLRDHPRLRAWRQSNWAAYQIVDYDLFGCSPTVISCDSDVLCLSEPVFLKQHLGTTSLLWNEDVRSCYSARPETLSRVTGLRVPAKVNCGFALTPRLTASDFDVCEEAIDKLAADPNFDLNHPYSSQTYFALIAAARAGSRPLPAEYAVYTGRTKPTSAVRHYVGIPSVRSRYFLEGLPLILHQAGLA